MKNGTLNQAAKILSLFEDTPREQIQAILSKGLLADLRDANIDEIDRDEFRRVCGLVPLKPENPPLLEKIGTVTIKAATEKFVAREKFQLNYGKEAKPGVSIAYLGDNFTSWFLEKTEEPKPETALDYSKLMRPSLDTPIMEELGEAKETMLVEIYALMERQAKGEEGVLLTNGWANIFYVRDANGTLRAVRVDWDSVNEGWHVLADPVTYSSRWSVGNQVFSRNSSVPVAV